MWIVSRTANPSGAYPSMQTWPEADVPAGYAAVARSADRDVFARAMGFVHLTAEGGAVTAITADEAAKQAYLDGLPAPEPVPPTAEEDRDAMLVDLEYRMTLLELGVTEQARSDETKRSE